METEAVPMPASVGVDILSMPPSFRSLGPAPGRKIDVIAVRGCSGNVHYQLDGPREGELVVWVHGLGDFCHRSDLLTMALVAAGYRVLRFDFFGRGWSDAPPMARYDLAMHVGQMRALMETLTMGGRPKTLIGHSMGGLIAQAYTEQHPTDVVRLVLLAPAGVMTSRALPPCFSAVQCLLNACTCLLPTVRSQGFSPGKGGTPWRPAASAPTAAERQEKMALDFHPAQIDSANCRTLVMLSRFAMLPVSLIQKVSPFQSQSRRGTARTPATPRCPRP